MQQALQLQCVCSESHSFSSSQSLSILCVKMSAANNAAGGKLPRQVGKV